MPYDREDDPFGQYGGTSSAPAREVVAVTPHDTNDLATYAKALYVGTGGDVAVIPIGNADAAPVTFANVPGGAFLPVSVRRVLDAGTTASDILALIR